MPSRIPDRSTWLAVYVGTIDSAFNLSEEEMFGVNDITRKLLQLLDIPDRGAPTVLPLPIALELDGKHFSSALDDRDASLPRPVRQITAYDCVASVEAWREALVGLIVTAYPDIRPDERLLATKVFTDLLASIGVPQRAATFHPQMVVEAHRAVDLGIA